MTGKARLFLGLNIKMLTRTTNLLIYPKFLMLKILEKLLQFCFLIFLPTQCITDSIDRDYPKREFRAVWVVTLDNKDFPSRSGLTADEQKAELIAMLDFYQQRGINAIIFQVRPSADAFYSSTIEPWSEWISGKQGQAPRPFYDPLQFVIEECHKRNMELHAWFNPFRGVFSLKKSDISPNHITYRRPEWFIAYGGRKQFDPGIPEVRRYIQHVVMDVVNRYDIDGVHFDDYFYPYRAGNQDFPDDYTFQQNRGYFTNKGDWRRDNINQLIKAVSDDIKRIKPHIKFGISPLGVWRNQRDDIRGSATSIGQTGYDYLGADALKWLQEGWIDYVAPQLYWQIGHKSGDYRVLADWWNMNNNGRHVYIGQAAFKIEGEGNDRWLSSKEIPNQLRFNRQKDQVKGSIFFRAKSVMDSWLADTLGTQFYRFPALVPPMAWKDNIPPNAPQNVRLIRTKVRALLKWDAPAKANDGETAAYYVVYKYKEGETAHLHSGRHIVSIQKERSFYEKIPQNQRVIYVITAIDRLHNESTPVQVSVE